MICGTYYIDSRVLILYEVNSDETISSQERVGDNDVNHFFQVTCLQDRKSSNPPQPLSSELTTAVSSFSMDI